MKIDRLVGIVLTLLEKKRIGAQELAETFEVSPRTIYRDVDAINAAGIPISSFSGVGGGFEIMQNYKIEKNVFSTADLSAILTGLYSLPDMVRDGELINALAKVKSFIPADRAKEVELKTNQIYIDLSPWMGNKSTERHLTVVKTALQENRLLAFDYADRYGNKTKRIAEPYRLILKSNRWYFQGYCKTREDFRLFRLSRITNLQMKKETFHPRACEKPQLDFPDRFEAMLTNVKLRVHRSVLDRVLDYCPYESCLPDGDEFYTVLFPFIENDYYYDVLFGFGDQCECLEPLRIRTEMKRRLQNILSLYEN